MFVKLSILSLSHTSKDLRNKLQDSNGRLKSFQSRLWLGRHLWNLCSYFQSNEHPNVYQWASESIKIPYRHPFTGKYTVYVPDFFIVYQDKQGRKHAEMVEVKPMS